MSNPKKVLLWVVSVGWLIPLWISANALFDWFHIVDRTLANEPELNSFPHIYFAQEVALVAGVWFSLVACYWAYRAARAL